MADRGVQQPSQGFQFGVKVSSDQQDFQDLQVELVMSQARLSQEDARWLVNEGHWERLMGSARYLVTEKHYQEEHGEEVDLTGD